MRSRHEPRTPLWPGSADASCGFLDGVFYRLVEVRPVVPKRAKLALERCRMLNESFPQFAARRHRLRQIKPLIAW